MDLSIDEPTATFAAGTPELWLEGDPPRPYNRNLALTPGSRLGRYQITAPIGAGGMGEVYRATDTSFDRQVAIAMEGTCS